jgi:hypothetical protein
MPTRHAVQVQVFQAISATRGTAPMASGGAHRPWIRLFRTTGADPGASRSILGIMLHCNGCDADAVDPNPIGDPSAAVGGRPVQAGASIDFRPAR